MAFILTLKTGILSKEFRMPGNALQDILGVVERFRVEFHDKWSLVYIRIPVESSDNGIQYHPIPPERYITDVFTITLCIQSNEILLNDRCTVCRLIRHECSKFCGKFKAGSAVNINSLPSHLFSRGDALQEKKAVLI